MSRNIKNKIWHKAEMKEEQTKINVQWVKWHTKKKIDFMKNIETE